MMVSYKAGAQDALMSGQSTFLAELATLPTTLASADQKSLLLFDELGRGTNVVDGMALALAIFHYIQREVGCRFIMATHWSESASLLDPSCVQLRQMASRPHPHLPDEHEATYHCAEGVNAIGYGIALLLRGGAHPEAIAYIKAALQRWNVPKKQIQTDLKSSLKSSSTLSSSS